MAMTEAQDFFEAMVREDDDVKRAELRRRYVEKVKADNRKALAKLRGQEVSVRWLWIIVAIDTAALFIMAVNR